MAKFKLAGVTDENIAGEEDGQGGGILRIIEFQVILETLETSVCQIVALRRSLSGAPDTEQNVEY